MVWDPRRSFFYPTHFEDIIRKDGYLSAIAHDVAGEFILKYDEYWAYRLVYQGQALPEVATRQNKSQKIWSTMSS